jgi:hypothetical protein
MPREYIRASLDFDDEHESIIDLSWSRDAEYVQVGVIKRAKVTHDTIHQGQYCQLDRGVINDLIRKLRRARDQAFGRDE